jgi:hypothetical protein
VTDGREATSRFVESFKTRHATDEVLEGLSRVRPLKILVIGEAIVDEYSYCTPIGKAPKDPIISAKHIRLERHAGGVLACANHVAGFCDEVHLLPASAATTPTRRSFASGSGRTSHRIFSCVRRRR